MTKLNIKTQTTHHIDYSNLESFIREMYGNEDYYFVADQECGNDSTHSFTVGAGSFLENSISDKEDVENFRKGKTTMFITRTLLQDIFEQGIIPAGEYLIEVCW